MSQEIEKKPFSKTDFNKFLKTDTILTNPTARQSTSLFEEAQKKMSNIFGFDLAEILPSAPEEKQPKKPQNNNNEGNEIAIENNQTTQESTNKKTPRSSQKKGIKKKKKVFLPDKKQKKKK